MSSTEVDWRTNQEILYVTQFFAGLVNPIVKDEFKVQDIDVLQCLDGFNIVLGHNLDIIYVSENVSDFIGLTQVSVSLDMKISGMFIFCSQNVNCV